MPKRKRKRPANAQGAAAAGPDQMTVESEEEYDPADPAGADAASPEPEDLEGMVGRLEAERDEAIEARKRALADFSNYQRRAAENEVRAVTIGASNVVRSLIPVLDNFDLALSQDTSKLTLDQLADGVRLVRDELFRALESHGVTVMDPEIGSPFDPNRHEAMFQQQVEGFEPNTIVDVLQPGYSMGDLVLRAAKVSVAAPDQADD